MQLEENLVNVNEEQNTQIEAAKMSYKQAQVEQQKVIQNSNSFDFDWN